MAELIEAVVSWPNLLLVLVMFGVAPGFCLRLIVLTYPRGDPRRTELIAELYAVPRIQRPLWVAEQLEVALFEGLTHRVSAALRRLTDRRRARAQTDKRGARVRRLEWPMVAGLVASVGGLLVGVASGVGVGVASTLASLVASVLAVAGLVASVVGVAKDKRRRRPPR